MLDQLVVEFPPALVGRERFVSISGLFERVPTDQHGTRALALVEAQQKIGKAEDGTGALVAAPADGLRQRVIGAMREGIPVCHEERSGLRCS